MQIDSIPNASTYPSKLIYIMDQGRTPGQVSASNKMMVTFLIAMGIFVLGTYLYYAIEGKSNWLQSVENRLKSK
ncbi:hypothetical protein [Pedobacter jejuensis]|uniref:Uncharacterized protein n=1 Tax=Pedobacter jejuensis TaxID=1268550 RepID=A0A3N0BVN7_9SPHI|nr:hypothetical protein [Pedobacter jejuensis]RNL53772.1 hypothetical protein D7004_09555 [Pedobacter jejuensis]